MKRRYARMGLAAVSASLLAASAFAGYKNAYPNYHVPRIAGQNFDYLVAALTEYKKGERAHPTMRAQGEGMSDQDIRNIAAYLSSLKP